MKKNNKDRKSDITPVGEAINEMLNQYKLNGRFDEQRLISAWEEVMGKMIANRTEKVFVKKDILFVKISSAPLKHELNMSKQKIIDNFREHLGKSIISEVIFM